MKYLIANWKQNKNKDEVSPWVEDYLKDIEGLLTDDIKIIICPPFSLVYEAALYLSGNSNGNIELGVQNISEFDSGAHTGEVGFDQLPDTVNWVIIGHSERRKAGESIDSVNKKIEVVIKKGKNPIVCFSNLDEYMQINNDFKDQIYLAYEPLSAIGTGNPESLENIRKVYDNVLSSKFIYGGSVDDTTVETYVNESFIKGFLVGGASLDPHIFANLTKKIR